VFWLDRNNQLVATVMGNHGKIIGSGTSEWILPVGLFCTNEFLYQVLKFTYVASRCQSVLRLNM
jgi:hypothetical protein